MSKRKRRTDDLEGTLKKYADSRSFELLKFDGGIHRRLIDKGFTTVDVWPTTGSYFVLQTNYCEMTDNQVKERGGEKGKLPLGEQNIFNYLDGIFFAADM